jgi:surface polysaccharide O-acyltransferase-like enzyme
MIQVICNNQKIANVLILLSLACCFFIPSSSLAFAGPDQLPQSGIQGYVDSFVIEGDKVIVQGWVAVVDSIHKVVSLSVWLGAVKIYEGEGERLERPDVVNAIGIIAGLKPGYYIKIILPDNVKSGKYPVKVLVKLDNGFTCKLATAPQVEQIFVGGRLYRTIYSNWSIGFALTCMLFMVFMLCSGYLQVYNLSVSGQGVNQRDIRLDFLRVIAAFSVVWLHVSAGVVVNNPDVHSMTWWIGNIADAFNCWGVPVFVMISGALLFSSTSNPPLIEFYKKRVSRLFPALFFWTLVYVVFRAYTDSTFDLTLATKSIVNGTPYSHLWYIYMFVGLNFVSPFLRPVVTGFDSGELRILIVGCFAIAAIESALGCKSVTFLPRFLPFVGYFLAGHYLLNRHGQLTVRSLVSILLVCGSVVAIAVAALFPLLGPESWGIMYAPQNPFVIVMAMCIFILCTKHINAKLLPKSLVRRIAPITLGVYLVHPLWLWLLGKFGCTGFLIHPVIGIPITSLLGFTLSVVTSVFLAKVPVLRRTVC